MTAVDTIGAYFRRVGYAGPREPTLAVLRDLHARHPAAIAFEGLDPFLGRPVDLDPLAIQAKLVHGRRGGYCHEHNALFYEVLALLGFVVVPLGGRVLWNIPGQAAPLTHRLTLVHLEEGMFVADVGFGGQTPTEPLRLEPDLEQTTSHGTYRVVRDGDAYETQMRLSDRWAPLYRFNLEPQTRADFEVSNWYTSTNPHTRFVQNLVAARIVGQTRVNLLNASLTIRHADGSLEQRTLTHADELQRVLEEIMGLELPVRPAVIWAKLPNQLFP